MQYRVTEKKAKTISMVISMVVSHLKFTHSARHAVRIGYRRFV